MNFFPPVGRAVLVKDSNQKVVGEFDSILKVAEYLEVNRNKVSLYLKSGYLLESKIGPVLLIEKGDSVSERSYKIQGLDKNPNLLDTYSSLRAAAKSYGLSPSSLSTTYLDKNKLCKGKYYFIKCISFSLCYIYRAASLGYLIKLFFLLLFYIYKCLFTKNSTSKCLSV